MVDHRCICLCVVDHRVIGGLEGAVKHLPSLVLSELPWPVNTWASDDVLALAPLKAHLGTQCPTTYVCASSKTNHWTSKEMHVVETQSTSLFGAPPFTIKHPQDDFSPHLQCVGNLQYVVGFCISELHCLISKNTSPSHVEADQLSWFSNYGADIRGGLRWPTICKEGVLRARWEGTPLSCLPTGSSQMEDPRVRGSSLWRAPQLNSNQASQNELTKRGGPTPLFPFNKLTYAKRSERLFSGW